MGTIQILKNRAGRYYVRVRHQNGHILCHCQAVGEENHAWALATNLRALGSANILLPEIVIAKNGEPFFRAKTKVSDLQRTFFSETYSSRAKAQQGLDAFFRICKVGVIEDLTDE